MTTPILGLPELEAAQTQKYLTANSTFRRLDALVNLTVFNRTTTAPPGSPSEGDRYIVAATATGAWVGQENNVAVYVGSSWIFFTPSEGWRAYDQGANEFLIFGGSSWAIGAFDASTLSSGSLLQLGINTASSTTNRLAVKSDAALFSHDDVTPGTGDMRITVNKSAAARDASFIFQTAFGSQAQFGLLGDNDFTLKVGGSSTTALIAKSATGAVELTQHPKFSAYLNFGQTITAGAWAKIPFNNERHDDQSSFSTGTSQFTAPHDGYYIFGAGYVFEDPGSSIPDEMRIGFSINGAAPQADRSITFADSYNFLISTKSSVRMSALLKLSASDTVEVQAFFLTNNGRILADENHFWGAQVA